MKSKWFLVSVHERVGDSSDYLPCIVAQTNAESKIDAFKNFMADESVLSMWFDDYQLEGKKIIMPANDWMPNVSVSDLGLTMTSVSAALEDDSLQKLILNYYTNKYTYEDLYQMMFLAAQKFDGYGITSEADMNRNDILYLLKCRKFFNTEHLGECVQSSDDDDDQSV